MPSKLFWEEKGAYIKWSGLITADENIRVNGEIYGCKNFDTIKYLISDILDAELPDFTDTNLRVIAKLDEQASKWNPNLKIAHVSNNPESVQLIKSYENKMDDSEWTFMVFDNLEDAREWVDSE